MWSGLLTFDLPAGLRAVQFTTSSRRGACCSRLGGRSGVAMAWAGWAQSSAAPECRGPEFQAKKNENNFLVTAKIGTPGYQTPERCIAILFLYYGVYRRRVHVGKTFNRFADFGLRIAQKNALPGPAGGAIALPRPPCRYKGRGGRKGKKVWE